MNRFKLFLEKGILQICNSQCWPAAKSVPAVPPFETCGSLSSCYEGGLTERGFAVSTVENRIISFDEKNLFLFFFINILTIILLILPPP